MPTWSDRFTSKVPDRFFRVPDKYNPYHRAHEKRIGVRHPSIQAIRPKFFKATVGTLIILQVLFFGLFCYIFGSLYTQNEHTHNIKILYMDYDGGVIGQSFRAAYQRLKADDFPTIVEEPPNGNTPDTSFLRQEVCSTHYWATLWTQPGASDRLSAALTGGSAAAEYNREDVVTFYWNEAVYPTAADSSVFSTLNTLSVAARIAYSSINGSGAINAMDRSDPDAIQAYSNPWQLQNINIKRTNQGSRAIYNTLCIILILIQEFFYLAALNGIYAGFKVYERLYPHRIIVFRQFISMVYTLFGSVCVTGAIWIFRDGWQVNANQFVLTWMVVWLFAHANFLILDAISVWVPPPFVPHCLITWVVINVAAILLPFELVPGFYKWGYALPAHAVYNTQMDIWSGGCNPHLDVTLPVLFAWEVLGFCLSCLGVIRRCHYAVIAQEAQDRAFQERLDSAMEFEKKHDEEKAAEKAKRDADIAAGRTEAEEEQEEEQDEVKDRDEMEQQLEMARTKSRRELKASRTNVSFGPSFSLPFNHDD